MPVYLHALYIILYLQCKFRNSGGTSMSLASQRELTCPYCGANQEVTVWESINISLDPELKEQLFAGQINVVRCEECEKQALIASSLLYHDMSQKIAVQYFPHEALQDASFLQRFNEDGTLKTDIYPPEMIEDFQYLVYPHIVFNLNEMLRYIQFREAIANRQQTGQPE